MTVWLTSDTHFGHPLLAALRGFYNDTKNGRNARSMREAGISTPQIYDWAKRSHISMKEIADTEAHDRFIIDSINSCVSSGDTLFHLGDVSFRTGIEYTIECMSQLDVPVESRHLIIGNHDKCFRGNTKWSPSEFYPFYLQMFSTIDETLKIDSISKDGAKDGELILCHFPWRDTTVHDEHTRERLLPFYPDRSRYMSHGRQIPLLYGHTHADICDEFRDEMAIHVGLDAWGMKPVRLETVCSMLRLWLDDGNGNS